MLSLATRKISGHCFSFARAALLLNCVTASAAGVDSDAQRLAAALLSRSVVAADHALVSLSPDKAGVTPADPMDQARHLLSGAPALPQAVQIRRAAATSRDHSTDEIAANAGAQESARRMILGAGA
jgi:hypothetical protein